MRVQRKKKPTGLSCLDKAWERMEKVIILGFEDWVLDGGKPKKIKAIPGSNSGPVKKRG